MRGALKLLTSFSGASGRVEAALAEAWILLDPSEADAGRGIVPNAVAETDLDTTEVLNLLKGRALGWGAVQATIAYNAENGPEGDLTAHQGTFAGGGNVGAIAVTGIRLLAGTYTAYADFKAAEGASSSQTVRWGRSTNLDAITITDAWQTFTQSFTLGDTATVDLHLPVKDASNNAYDVVVDNVRITTGAAHAEATPSGHLRFGLSTMSSGNPTFSGNTIDPGSIRAVMRFPEKTLTGLTILYAINQDTAISGAASFWPGRAEGYPSLAFGPAAGATGGAGASLQLTGGGVSATYLNIKDRGWFIVGCRAQTGLKEIFSNNCILGHAESAWAGVTTRAMLWNNLGNFPLPEDFYVAGNDLPGVLGPFVFFDRFLTTEEYVAAAEALRLRLVAGGNTLASNINVLFAGDSITADDSSEGEDGVGSYAFRVLTAGVATHGGAVYAAGGNSLADMAARLDWQLPWIEQSVLAGNDVICSLLAGANGVFTADPNDFFDDLVDYYDQVRAVGAKMLACTVLPQNNATFNTNRAVVNGLLRSNPSVYDGLCDFDTVVDDADAADTNLFNDGVHLTGAGYDLITPVAQAALDDIISAL
jgi:lysophospholipase L1-like esterase